MKQIPLTKGQVAIVDDRDFKHLSKFKWCAHVTNSGQRFYAVRRTVKSERRTKGDTLRLMHHEIMGSHDELQIDHVNRNSLDNRRENLRFASPSENRFNRKQKRGKTGWIGVYLSGRGPRCWANVHAYGFNHYLGTFPDAESAAAARDAAAEKLHGEFAQLNQVGNDGKELCPTRLA